MRLKTHRLEKRVSLVSPWPAILLEGEDAVVLADIHLGMEDLREAEGIHVPRTVFPDILRYVVKPVQETGASRVVLLGDLKHEFGRPVYVEWAATRKLLKSILDLGVKIDVVRGNHDNYIMYVLKELDISVHQPFLQLGRNILFHGHMEADCLPEDAAHIVVGHEHPAIALRDDLGVKHRYKAFLSGRWKSSSLTVLPSVSPLATGTDVNDVPQNHFLSPLLRQVNIEDFVPYLIDVGEATERFPRVGELRSLSWQPKKQ